MRKGVKKTHEEFLLELNELNAKCEPIEEYNGKDVDIKFKCLRCGGIFHQTPQVYLIQKSFFIHFWNNWDVILFINTIGLMALIGAKIILMIFIYRNIIS